MLESTVTPYAYVEISYGLFLFVSLAVSRSLAYTVHGYQFKIRLLYQTQLTSNSTNPRLIEA